MRLADSVDYEGGYVDDTGEVIRLRLMPTDGHQNIFLPPPRPGELPSRQDAL